MRAFLAISGGFVGWAIVHSLLASGWLKSWVAATLGDGTSRWYRVFYVAFAVLTLVPIFALVLLLPDQPIYTVPTPWRWLMTLGQVGALAGLGLSLYQAGLMHFVGLAQLLAENPDATGELQVQGIYRYVRHPLYLFSVVLIWLTPSMTRNLATLFACMTVFFVVGSVHEEALLLREYGHAYEVYRRQVPRFVPLPGRHYGGRSAA